MKRITRWWETYIIKPMTMTMAEASWFGFVLSALLLASAVNIGTSLLLSWTGPGWTLLSLLLAAAGTLVFANYYFHYQRRRLIEEGKRVFGEREGPKRREGLIVMVTLAPTARKAIEYHLPVLKHLWLITTPEMRKAANELRTHVERQGGHGHVLELDQEYDANRCYALVRSVYEHGAIEAGLAPSDVIADMTGGTKPMTAGMVLACIDMNAALEHVPTKFTGAGQPSIPLDPIEVIISRTRTTNP